VQDNGDVAGKIGKADRERMEAALADVLEEQDDTIGRTTEENYEKLREVEEVCGIIKQVGSVGMGAWRKMGVQRGARLASGEWIREQMD
jgi:hypothetical protein